ncbi:MAG TPA: 1,6-anhydro-N-acetylmuramyl-L-alanine amidase AmpD [Gammaproteobacteria bacterium]|nr:1,6-anhydro-N-acetylmuramyl-L-alanine amidase AmpD [Gammaproteobacteria bacterium]|tara:strand:+ start:154 stop:684 length:531 start_codon:yes stop_codon:yes gene_type:complete
MKNHRFSDALWIPSPHFDERPSDTIDLIVIHAISLPPNLFNPLPVMAFFQGLLDNDADAFFEKLREVRVSSHLVIGRGGAVYQFVAFDKRAWHAGESDFQGRARCNDFSIGIELIGDEEGPFTAEQYRSLSGICDRLCVTYEIPKEHIVGHRDIAPGRKVDPGADFEYSKIRPSAK